MSGPFAKLLAKLADADVHCVIVGGVAVCLHGYVRATADLDILVEPTAENVRRLLDVLATWGDGHAKELSVDDFLPAELGAVRIGEDFTLDVFTLMRGRESARDFDFATLRMDAKSHILDGFRKILFLSADQLIELKSGTGRVKDVLDVEALREIVRGRRTPHPASLETMEPVESHDNDDDSPWLVSPG